MKRVLIIIVLMLGVFLLTPALAQEEAAQKVKGASQQAYEHADDNAIFNRTADWFATIGKSAEEREKILAERKTERAAKRAEKEAKKAQKKAEEVSKEAKKGLEDAGQKAQKQMGEANKQMGDLMKKQEKK